MKIAPIKVFSFFLLLAIIILVVIELYLGAGWFSNDAIYRVESQDIINDEGQEIAYHTKTSDQSFYEEYAFQVYEDSIINDGEPIFMMIHQPVEQEMDIFLNQNLISSYGKKVNLHYLMHEQILVVPINTQDIYENNYFNIILGGKVSAGFYGDVFFINEDLLLTIERLTNISHVLKSFIVYAAIMLAIGFFGFAKIVVDYEDSARAKSFQLISIVLLLFVLHSSSLFNNLYINNRWLTPQLFEGFMFLGALTVFTLALYTQVKDSLIFKIFIFQLVVACICVPILSLIKDGMIIINIVKFIMFLLTVLSSVIYMDSSVHNNRKHAKVNVRIILIFVLIGQLISVFNSYVIFIPMNVMEIISKTIPIAVGMVILFNNVFTELVAIRKKNEEERTKLKNLNTNIYEYVSEGVFSISDNLIVNDMYTKVCQEIFERDLSGVKIPYLLEDDENPASFIERLLKDLFAGKIPWIAGVELLPVELIVKERIYELSYQKIEKNNKINEIIVKVSDRTDTRDLSDELLYERDKLALSITSVMNREELLPLVNEFIEYMDALESSDYSKTEVLNTIHTYKGNFGIFSFIHVLKALHELESKLLKESTIEESDVAFVVDELYKDLEIITEITGSSFFEDTVYLKANVNNLEIVYDEVKKYFYDTEASLIIFIIKKIFNKSMKDIVLFYGREARKKAGERGKEIKTITVTGDDIFIDYNYYKSAIRSLVHIFNNCIDHGIEDEEERLIIGKPKYGEIQCRISDYGNFFEIVIKDDGRGIDLERLAERLIENEILTQEELNQLSEEELLEYVFLGEVSTQDEASLTSGRGVGLSSVKTEVEKVGGEIRIISFLDFGTEVKVLLPKENEALISYFSLPLLMDLYVEAFKIYVKSNNIFDLPLNIVGSEKISELYDYNVKIKFEGPEVGYFFMSCNKSVLWKLACYLTENINMTEDDFEQMSWEVIKETCNIVSGNSTSIFDLNSKYINILSPEEVNKEYFDKGNLIYTWHMKYASYGVILGLILD